MICFEYGSKPFLRRIPALFLSLAAGASLAQTADRPDWLGDASATVRETYDGNVFLSGVDSHYYHPPGYSLSPGSVAALKNQSASVTAVAARFGVNFLPWSGTNLLSQLSLTYTPEFDIYQEVSSETHYDHRFLGKLQGRSGDWSFSLDENFLFVDGSRIAPTYPGKYVTAYNVGAPRERRQQLQDRAAISIRHDSDQWFIRPGANLMFYDLQTEQRTNAGYQNFCSRYDARGSLDAGYKLTSQTALTLGTQAGRQGQEKFSFSAYESSSDYLRILGGAEGRPLPWLTVKFQAGPDFRSYDLAAPVSHHRLLTYYDECSFTARLSDRDALTLDGRQFQWVSSLGSVPYFDTTASLNWHHACTTALGLDLGVKFLSADYRSADLTTCRRVDTETCLTTGLGYAITRRFSVNLTGEFDLGLNDLPGVTDPSTRDFRRFLVSLGTTWQF